MRAPVRVLLVLTALAVLVFCVSVVPGVREAPGFRLWLDGWLQGTAYVLTAAVALVRPLTSGADRAVWALVAAGLVCRAAAFVVYLGVVRTTVPVPAPSVADVGWLASCVLLLAALATMTRSRFTGLTWSLLLDGAVAALAVGAVLVVLLDGSLTTVAGSGGPRAAVATALAYPALDAALLAVVVGLLVAVRWRPAPDVLLLVVGVAGFALLDCVYLFQVAGGSFRPGTWLSALSLLATATMAAAGLLVGTGPGRKRTRLPGTVVPVVLSMLCLGLLVLATVRDVPWAAVALAAAGTVAVVGRTAVSFRDVRAHAEARIEARTDDLTGVANRRAFTETLDGALRHRPPERPLALLVVDLDQFKAVNDSLGHHRGDELLVLVAQRLQLVLREVDLLARIGGDEFAVVLDGADPEQAGHVAQRLRAAFRTPFGLAARDVSVSASVGIAVFPADGHDGSDLLQHADLAMYDAKTHRTGHGWFRPEVHRASQERVERVERLRTAIQDGEMVLRYQPQVSLLTGEVVAVEALVRWEHPEQGLLLPSAFLRHAENGGLMRTLTADVLGQALGQCAAWRAAGTPLVVAVNLSVSNLLDLELPDQVAMLLEANDLPGSSLVLELTEDLFMADPARGNRVMARLSTTGAAMVVDDYGTGYSSLGYVRDLPHISGLKLDRSFVTGLDGDRRAGAIVASTVTLAGSLGLDLLAEGVETPEVRDELVRLGCLSAQGYLFAHPVAAEDVPRGVIAAAVPRRP